MILRTLGWFILAAGASYLLASASWQVVLLLFLMAGVGFASWRIRKAFKRRAKIKALWQRSMRLNAAINSAANALLAEPVTAVPPLATLDTVTADATNNSYLEDNLQTGAQDLKKRIISLDLSEIENKHHDTPQRPLSKKAMSWFEETKLDSFSKDRSDEEDQLLDSVSWGSREELNTMSKGGRVYKFRMSDFANTSNKECLTEMLRLST